MDSMVDYITAVGEEPGDRFTFVPGSLPGLVQLRLAVEREHLRVVAVVAVGVLPSITRH